MKVLGQLALQERREQLALQVQQEPQEQIAQEQLFLTPLELQLL
jgi:hypothetical protein